MTTFAEWAEAFSAGYMACREGLPDDDGETFLKAVGDAWKQSGGQRAQRVANAVRDGESFGDAYARENPNGVRL